MKRPVKATALAAVAVVVVVTLGVGFSVGPSSLGFVLAVVCFALGVNARPVAVLPVRLLDGSAAVAGGYAVGALALGRGETFPVAVLAFSVALACGSFLHAQQGDSAT